MYLLEKNFDTAFESLNGIKELRNLILKLAMMGKLVPQDKNDQPASELLKEIEAEKQKLIKEGKIKKQKPLPEIRLEEVPYELPEGWVWCRLGDVGIVNPKNNIEDSVEVGFVSMPMISAKYGEKHSFTKNIWKDIKKGYTHFANDDVGLAKITPCFENGKSCVFDNLPNDVGAGTTELHIYRNYSKKAFYPYFLFSYFKNPSFIETGKVLMTGSAGQKRVPRTYFSNSPVPLPPLNEQKRIVDKIDELMDRCDEMERLKKEQEEKRLKTNTAALHQLLESADKESFNSAFNFITGNFSSLYSVKENMEELKKSILQLAMMGKLVPQDKNDQPASELLKEIQAEKKKLIKEGKIKKQKPLPEIRPEEIPYELPEGWVWTRLGELGSTNVGLTYKPSQIVPNGIPVLRSSNIQNGKIDLTDLVHVSATYNEKDIIRNGDLLICARNGSRKLVGKCAILENLTGLYTFGAFMAIFRSRLNKFILMFILSPQYRSKLDGVETTTINQITQTNLKMTLFPLPPLNEQKRIVAKIDELMACCDEMIKKIEQSEQTKEKLLASVISKV